MASRKNGSNLVANTFRLKKANLWQERPDMLLQLPISALNKAEETISKEQDMYSYTSSWASCHGRESEQETKRKNIVRLKMPKLTLLSKSFVRVTPKKSSTICCIADNLGSKKILTMPIWEGFSKSSTSGVALKMSLYTIGQFRDITHIWTNKDLVPNFSDYPHQKLWESLGLTVPDL